MKKILLATAILALFSCKKNTEATTSTTKTAQENIDSINAARAKYNDSIKILNERNRFPELSGSHKLTYKGDGADLAGTVQLTKAGRDEYSVKGNASAASNNLSISGKIKQVSEKHLNFEGEISQKIGGSRYVRTKKTTFLDEGKGNYWRLQDKVNGDRFIEYIDIHR